MHSPSGFWFVKGARKHKIISGRVLASWNFPRVVEVSDESIAHLTSFGRLGFRDGTLVQSMAGQVYIISESKRRKVTSPDWFDILAIDFNDAVVVSDEELELHGEGEVLA